MHYAMYLCLSHEKSINFISFILFQLDKVYLAAFPSTFKDIRNIDFR